MEGSDLLKAKDYTNDFEFYDCIIIIIIIIIIYNKIIIIIIIMALFCISTRWLFICKIHLLKNISAKKIQISYFYQNEIHLLRNKVTNIGPVK